MTWFVAFRKKWVLLIAAMAALTLTLLLWRPWAAKEPPLAWLPPAQFAAAVQPGPLAQLKWRVMNLATPIWRRIVKHRTQMQLEVESFAQSSAQARYSTLPAPNSTNAAGVRAWVLSPREMDALRASLKTASASVLSEGRITTGNGARTRLFMGGSPGSSALSVDATAKAVSSAIKMTIEVISTETPSGGGGIGVGVGTRTNLYAACSASVQQRGGLVLEKTDLRDPAGSNCWLLIRPMAIDAHGKPLKL
jgi:hypothetical protein